MAEWYLETHGQYTDLSFIKELKEFRDYTVGRKRHFDIVSTNPLVSRDHGLFKHKRDNKIYVRDTNSSNGIWVNDVKIEPNRDQLLQENDIVGLGAPPSAYRERVELFRLCRRTVIDLSDEDTPVNIESAADEPRCPVKLEPVNPVPSSSGATTVDAPVAGPSSRVAEAVPVPVASIPQEIEMASSLLSRALCALDASNEVVRQTSEKKDMTIHLTVAIENCRCRGSAESHRLVEGTCVRCSVPAPGAEANSAPAARAPKPERLSVAPKPERLSIAPKPERLSIAPRPLDPVTISSSDDEQDDVIFGPVPRVDVKREVEPEAQQVTKHEQEPDADSDRDVVKAERPVCEEEDKQATINAILKKIPMVVLKKLECISSSCSSSFSSQEDEIVPGRRRTRVFDSCDSDASANVGQRKSAKRRETARPDRRGSAPKDTGQSSSGSKKRTSDGSKASDSTVPAKSSVTEDGSSSSASNKAKEPAAKKSTAHDKKQAAVKEKSASVPRNSGEASGEKHQDRRRSKSKSSQSVGSSSGKSNAGEKRTSADRDRQPSGEKSHRDKRKSSDSSERAKERKTDHRSASGEKRRSKSRSESREKTAENNNNNADKLAVVPEVPSEESVAVQEPSGNETSDTSPTNAGGPSGAFSAERAGDLLVAKQKIKREPASPCFGDDCNLIEVISLSDDDDEDMFPQSQLFTDPVVVKSEPATSSDGVAVKLEATGQEAEADGGYPAADESDQIFGIIKQDVDFDDSAVDVEEDDDEDSCVWYSKLSQSQFPMPKQVKLEEWTGQAAYSDAEQEEPITEVVSATSKSLVHTEPTVAADQTDGSSMPPLDISSDGRSVLKTPAVAVNAEVTDAAKPESTVKKSYVKPPVIEAPALVKGRRKTVDVKAKQPPSKEPDKRGRKRKQACEEPVPVPVACKTLKTELDKRLKKRRRASTDPLSREQKREIREERTRKLKELAKAAAAGAGKQDKHRSRGSSKPYVKVSNSRGLFLTDEESAREAEKRRNPVVVSASEPVPKKKYTIPRKPPVEAGKVLEEVNKTAEGNTEGPSDIFTNNITIITTTSESGQGPEKENVNGPEPTVPAKKRVTFSDVPLVRVYQIDEGNCMVKCTAKDAPMPKKSGAPARPHSDVPADTSPLENLALWSVLSWSPGWLDAPFVPRVSAHKPMQMLHTFNTYGDYCNIVLPLLLLELWSGVLRDWSLNSNRVMYVQLQEVTSYTLCDTAMLSLRGFFVVTREENDSLAHPVRGDLLILEVLLPGLGAQLQAVSAFGFVANVHKRRVHERETFHPKLLPPSLPNSVVNVSICLKSLPGTVDHTRIMRIRVVSRIGPSLRIFKSVTVLQQSALCNFILKPNITHFRIPKLNETKLVVQDELDADQLRCMLEACQVCTRSEPGIYMIQGPPGTGKSRVIKNLVQQLLYADRKPGVKPSCILLCAPSNGAIDELSMKLLEMRQSLPHEKRFRMVRLGPPNSIHPKVKPISLLNLVESFVKKQLQFNMADNGAVVDDLNFRKSKINMLENKLQSYSGNQAKRVETTVQLQRAKLDLDLFLSRSKRELTQQEKRTLERESEVTVIHKADIVCTTLSSCVGSRMEELFDRKLLRFTCCIVDEATQSNEQETLIPLILGINKLVLVGDPAQLPATVLSNDAKALGYGHSLFYRLQKCLEHLPDNPIRMLKTQYRMHPDICKFPNEHFYGGQLITCSATRDRSAGLAHRYRVFALLPSKQQQQQQPQRSADVYLNVPEAGFVVSLARAVLARTASLTVGIITPYARQREFLRRRLDEIKDTAESDRVSVNTVDGFQGQERDVIIISCVRHTSNTFLADEQRLNVSLTRAKRALFICGQARLFKSDDIWTRLAEDAAQRSCMEILHDNVYENERFVASLIGETNGEVPSES